jgi:hypothetical protein
MASLAPSYVNTRDDHQQRGGHEAHGSAFHAAGKLLLHGTLWRMNGRQSLQSAAIDSVLRPMKPTSESSGLTPDALAVPVVERQFFNGSGDCRQSLRQAELGKLANGDRLQVDAQSKSGNAWSTLEDPALNTLVIIDSVAAVRDGEEVSHLQDSYVAPLWGRRGILPAQAASRESF